MKNWFILFVIDGSEMEVIKILNRKLDKNDYLPFIPTKEIVFRRQGTLISFRKPIFPGYVFIQTTCEANRIMDELSWLLFSIKQVHSVLHYGEDKKAVALHEDERMQWERLFDQDFCILKSYGKIEDGKMHFTSGPLLGLEDKIIKITRLNNKCREAIIELELMNKKIQISMMIVRNALPIYQA